MNTSAGEIVGIDFAGPRLAQNQRYKIIAIWAHATGPDEYVVSAEGKNERLFRNPPGWSAEELTTDLVRHPVALVGPDFAFSLPQSLLLDPRFAQAVGLLAPIGNWDAYLRLVDEKIAIGSLDFGPFDQWRNTLYWKKRATDVAAIAQPPLKHRFQNLFQMTLLGAKVLRALRMAGYAISPFDTGGKGHEVVEIYPGQTLRRLGLRQYKTRPSAAMHGVLHRLAAAGLNVDVAEAVVERAIEYESVAGDHDIADAFVALATAILYRHGHCEPALTETTAAVTVEGVIWRPKALAG